MLIQTVNLDRMCGGMKIRNIITYKLSEVLKEFCNLSDRQYHHRKYSNMSNQTRLLETITQD